MWRAGGPGINKLRSNRPTCVFVFQGGFLWGGLGWGEKDSEIGGRQVYPQEGLRGQGKQHWEWDSSTAQVSGLLCFGELALIGPICLHLKKFSKLPTPYFEWNLLENTRDQQLFIQRRVNCYCKNLYFEALHITLGRSPVCVSDDESK